MILIACLSCHTALRISGDHDEMTNLYGPGSDWYPDKYPCPIMNCGKFAEIITASGPEAMRGLDVHELTANEAFCAFNGLGMPAERDCSATAVTTLFEKHPVAKLAVRHIKGTHRSVIDWLEFDDGSRLYLGSSAYGATVYRIAKPHSYVVGVHG